MVLKPVPGGALPVARETPYRLLVPAGRAPAGGWPGVIALHGYGWDEVRFAAVVRRRFAGMRCVWIVPRGPWRLRPEGGELGYGWLLGSREHPDHEGMRAVEGYLDRVVRDAGRRVSLIGRPAILGFSQGGFVAGVAALRRPRRYRMAVVLGAYINPLMVPKGLGAAKGAKLAFLHGRQDGKVPLGRARESVRLLSEAGIPATLRTFPGGHKLSEVMAGAAARLLE